MSMLLEKEPFKLPKERKKEARAPGDKIWNQITPKLIPIASHETHYSDITQPDQLKNQTWNKEKKVTCLG